MTLEEFAPWLKSELERKGMSQAQLASKAGISRNAVNKYIHGKMLPTFYVFMCILDALGMKMWLQDDV